MTTIKLQNGIEMPIVGLGTWQTINEEGIKAIQGALDAGYRLIDTASAYNNEEEVGKALEEYFKSGKLSRKDVFITTKLWCNNSRPEDVEPTLRKQLAALRTDYVDLYLIHHPTAYNKDMSAPEPDVKPEHTWKAMEQIYHKGLAKSIGISNFNEAQIEKVLEVAEVPIHNHQIEVHLYFQQHKLVDFCQKKGISVTAYAPIGSPGRITFELPNGKSMIWPEGVPDPLKEPYVHELGQKYGKSPAQILLKYLVQRNIAVVPKSSNPKRIKENIDIFDFEISADEMKKLNSLDKNCRIFTQAHYIGHPDDPWKDERE